MTTLRERVPLRKRKIFKKSIGGFLKNLPIALILGLVLLFVLRSLMGIEGAVGEFFKEKEATFSFICFFAIGLWLFSGVIYQTFYFYTYHYDVDDNNVWIRKGVIIKKEVNLPFSKITDVYVDQDLFDVVLGIYDVHISTPTVESGLFAHIDGVDKAGSLELRSLILDRINKETVAKA